MEPEDPILRKRMWTDQDFEKMTWHDVKIHAMALNPYRKGKMFFTTGELVFDIDYILKWVQTADKPYGFWVAPATLVFNNVTQVTMHSFFPDPVWEIDDIQREEVKPASVRTWLWKIWDGELSFRSTGFSQYIRKEPVLQDQQELSLRERGGISFETTVQREFEC